MIEFIQTVGGQRFLAKAERFMTEFPEKLDKIADSLDDLSKRLDRLAAIRDSGITTKNKHIGSNFEDYEKEEAKMGKDSTEEKIVDMPMQDEHHIPISFGGDDTDFDSEHSTPSTTGAMNRQHEKKETTSDEEATSGDSEEEDSRED